MTESITTIYDAILRASQAAVNVKIQMQPPVMPLWKESFYGSA